MTEPDERLARAIELHQHIEIIRDASRNRQLRLREKLNFFAAWDELKKLVLVPEEETEVLEEEN